ncbi:transporter substrate-binding domain-containing protein [Nonomuraea jiangxiensis]|uniref:Polar amino acid transport system substrate-binding protein n=1 Tax=Nonomuraea jiangxiensis TaxID=633440 RepID=A0A1G9G2B8_9ACTN|nr:transporter substrate-binding domain-containing protein [Nonomuraea jiangxiensis]SDK94765.1 polar amino acid transport system substrate-binding protein [Nonomuraea jiangxiensis]
MTTKVAGLLAVLVMAVAGCGSATGETAGTQGAGSGKPVDVGAPLPADVRAKGRLAVGVKCDYPPFGFIDESGAEAGFEVEIARRLGEYAFGTPGSATLTCVTGANRVPYLTTKRIDLIIATMNYTPERAESVDFSTPYFNSGVKLLVPKDSPITSFADLEGKPVTTTTGSTASIWLAQCVKSAKQVTFGQTSEAYSAMRSNRAVAFAQDDTLLAELASKNPGVKVVGEQKAGSPWGMGVRKSDAAMLAWVNAAIEKMRAEDSFWTAFQRTVTDKGVQQQFEQFVPRPGDSLEYPAGEIIQC